MKILTSVEMAEAINEEGELLYGESHILCNLFSIDAIERMGRTPLPYHSAFKKAKYIDKDGKIIVPDSPNAYKFEAFLFDAFGEVDDMAILRSTVSTSPRFLTRYDKIFKTTPKIIQKTDNLPLFEYSLESLKEYGYNIDYKTYDLHNNKDNIITTEYEDKFTSMGVKINYLEASKEEK